MDTVMGRMEGKSYSPSIYLSVTLSSLDFWIIKLPFEVTKHLYDIKNTLHKLTKISSNSSLSFLPIMVESCQVDDIEMDVRESKLFFVTLIALTRKENWEKSRWFATFYLKELLWQLNSRTSISSAHVNSVKRAFEWKVSYELFAFTYGEEILSFSAFLKYLQKTSVSLLNYSNISSKN